MWLGFPRRSVVPFSGCGQAYGSERSAEFGMREMNQLTLQAESETSISYRRVSTVLIVVTAALLLAAAAMSRSFYDGRMASPVTHNDVNYFLIGIRHVVMLREHGILAVINDFVHGVEHAPIASYQAMLAYLIFGINDLAPYASNLVYVLIFLGVAAYLMRDCPVVILVAGMATVIAMPLTSSTLTEFAPELVCSLFTAIGALLMLRLPLIGAPLGARFRAGVCFCLGFLAHPSAFAFTLIAVLGTVGLMLLRDVIVIRKAGFARLLSESALNFVLSTWLAALYMIPEIRHVLGVLFSHHAQPRHPRALGRREHVLAPTHCVLPVWTGRSIHVRQPPVGVRCHYRMRHRSWMVAPRPAVDRAPSGTASDSGDVLAYTNIIASQSSVLRSGLWICFHFSNGHGAAFDI